METNHHSIIHHSSYFPPAEDWRMSTAKLFLFAMAMAAVFIVGVKARVAAHNYNNHEVSCHSRNSKMVEIFTIKLSQAYNCIIVRVLWWLLRGQDFFEWPGIMKTFRKQQKYPQNIDVTIFSVTERKILCTTIPDKTTRKSFPHHVHFPTQQNYLQNDAFAERKPLPQFNVASYERPGIRLPFEYTTTLLSGKGGEGKTGTATVFRKMLPKYAIFSTVLVQDCSLSILLLISISDENLLRVQAGVEKKSAKKGHIISNFVSSFGHYREIFDVGLDVLTSLSFSWKEKR